MAYQVSWRAKSTWLVLATEDRTGHPDLQCWVSERMGAIVTTVDSSHVLMLWRPDLVIEANRSAVTPVQIG